jgi:hypothetical protein
MKERKNLKTSHDALVPTKEYLLKYMKKNDLENDLKLTNNVGE